MPYAVCRMPYALCQMQIHIEDADTDDGIPY
jgi:hypothetical protein